VAGLTRVSIASAEKNYHDDNCEDGDLEEAAHLKRVVGVSFGRNSTDVLFEWPAKNFVLMGTDCPANALVSVALLLPSTVNAMRLPSIDRMSGTRCSRLISYSRPTSN